MKKFTSLLIGCSLALTGAAMAQQPEEKPTPMKKQAAEKAHAAEARPGANAAKSQGGAAKPEGAAMKQHGTSNGPAAVNAHKAHATAEPATATSTEGTKVPRQTATGAMPGAEHQHKGMKALPQTRRHRRMLLQLQRQRRVQLQQLRRPASLRRHRLILLGPRLRSPIRSRCSRSRHSTRPPGAAEATAGSCGHVHPELSDPGKRPVAGSAIRSIPLVSSVKMHDRPLNHSLLQSRGADRWRLLLLEQQLLVSGVGLRSFRRSIMPTMLRSMWVTMQSRPTA